MAILSRRQTFETSKIVKNQEKNVEKNFFHNFLRTFQRTFKQGFGIFLKIFRRDLTFQMTHKS